MVQIKQLQSQTLINTDYTKILIYSGREKTENVTNYFFKLFLKKCKKFSLFKSRNQIEFWKKGTNKKNIEHYHNI